MVRRCRLPAETRPNHAQTQRSNVEINRTRPIEVRQEPHGQPKARMSLSNLPLSYCTNVHPGRTLAEIEQGLDRYTVNVAARFGAPLAAGLWLAKPVVDELLQSDTVRRRFAAGLAKRGLTCHTLNAFPFGDFHSPRVKEQVYRPSWAEPQRLEFSVSAARILAELLPNGVEGSISTLPLGYPGIDSSPDFLRDCAENLIDAALSLHRLEEETGGTIRLAIEPEPCCWLDETPATIDFFTNRLWPLASQRNCLDAVRRHVGLCLDVCHQAVAFEEMRQSVAHIDQAGIRINKIHITCAIELENPATNLEGRRALARYVEPRYLHQTKAHLADGRVLAVLDLNQALALDPPQEFLQADRWRVHFHVPVDAERLGPLKTTRADLRTALAAVKSLSYAPHLEVETYTWEVLPDLPAVDLVDGLTRELAATRSLLGELSTR
jgi:sugar phosphate isomerase/epimerase